MATNNDGLLVLREPKRALIKHVSSDFEVHLEENFAAQFAAGFTHPVSHWHQIPNTWNMTLRNDFLMTILDRINECCGYWFHCFMLSVPFKFSFS